MQSSVAVFPLFPFSIEFKRNQELKEGTDALVWGKQPQEAVSIHSGSYKEKKMPLASREMWDSQTSLCFPLPWQAELTVHRRAGGYCNIKNKCNIHWDPEHSELF